MLAIGDTIGGDFRVVQKLSEGGMGAVYVVEQISTGKRRALKTMKPELVRDARFRERFALEARAGSRIDSEHVVEVVAAGIDEGRGTPWLAMELLDGADLASVVAQRGALPFGEVVEAFQQMAHALSKAHQAGIVHRDLKPENIFVARPRRDGVPFTVKILDFGIAKLVSDAADATATGALGTPLWMSPEQADSRGTIGPAADIWPLGLIAYYALTGHAYWRAAESNSTLTALLKEVLLDPLEPPSSRGWPGLPPRFDAWFFACVARDPGARFPSVRAAVDALAALGDSANVVSALAATAAVTPAQLSASYPSRSVTPPAPARPKGRSTAVTLALILAGVACLAIVGNIARMAWKIRKTEKEIRDLREGTDEDKARFARADELMKTVDSNPSPDMSVIPIERNNPAVGTERPFAIIALFCGWRDDDCIRLSKLADEALRDKSAHVRVAYKHAVPRSDKEAKLAAEAAQGVFEAVGGAGFVNFRDAIFAHRGEITRANVVTWAREAGVLDPEELGRRLDEGRWAPIVDRDSDLAARLGFGTSRAFANCQPVGMIFDVWHASSASRDELLRRDDARLDGGIDMTYGFAPYRDQCEERAKKGPVPERRELSVLVRSPFASEASEDAVRELVVRHLSERPATPNKTKKPTIDLAALDIQIERDTKDSAALTATVAELARKASEPPRVVVQKLRLTRVDAKWRLDSADEAQPHVPRTCAERARVALLTTPRVADDLLATPTRAERDAGCFARAASVGVCYSQSCNLEVVCHAGTSLQTVARLELEPHTGKLFTQKDIQSPREEIPFPAADDIRANCSDDKARTDGAATRW